MPFKAFNKKNAFSTKGVFILLENSVIINNSETTERKTAMEVYVEYAFLENFLYDGVLLWLSLRASLTPVRVWKVAVSAAIGAIFALLYPLLTLPVFLLQMLKLAVGFLLCLLVMPGIKNKKDRGRYAMKLKFPLLAAWKHCPWYKER